VNFLRIGISAVALLHSALGFAGTSADAPFHCYLTWQSDPTTTLTVNFHTVNPHTAIEVLYDTSSRGGVPAAYRSRAVASTHVIPGLNDISGARRYIHVAELTGLTPGGVYYFVAGSAEGGYTSERSVRLPSRDIDDLRFVDGGDMAVSSFVAPLLQAAAAQSPQFAVLGGDLAYENGDLASFAVWDEWLTNWESNMITPEGHSVPMILAIGNHEVAGGWGAFADPLGSAPFYFGLFAQSGRGFDMPRRAYFRLDFGPDASLLVLDTGHVTAMDGAQAVWLEDELAQLGGVELRMTAYHVPMYPSHRGFDEPEIADVRSAWLELFDTWGLHLALEHHDHMLKRTKRLRDSAPDPDGTVYLGDGCFGQTPRTGAQALALEDPAELAVLGLTENYLAAWAPERNFWLIEVERDEIDGEYTLNMTALDAAGTTLDEGTVVIDVDDDGSNGGFVCISAVIFARVPGTLSTLHHLRDTQLLPYAPGAAFTDAYYRLSAPAVQWLNARPGVLSALQTGAIMVNIRTTLLLLLMSIALIAARSRQRWKRRPAASY